MPRILRQILLRKNIFRVSHLILKHAVLPVTLPSKCISFCANATTPSVHHFQDSQRNKGNTNKIPISPAILLLAATIRDQNNEEDSQNRDIKDLLKTAQRIPTKQNKEKEKILTNALHLALERREISIVAHIQDELASMALQAGDYDKALKLLINVIKNLIDTGIKENDIAVLEISLKLATLYATSQKHDIAINGYEWVIEKSRENLKNCEKVQEDHKNNQAFLGMALDSYGRYLFMLRKTKQALDVTKEAIEISTDLFGDNDIRTLVLLNDYGAILTDCGEYGEAEKVIEKAIESATKCKDAKHSDVAVFWVNLGSVYSKNNKFGKATEAYIKAKKEAVLSRNRSLQIQVEQYIAEDNKSPRADGK